MAQNRIDIRGQQIEPVMLLDNGVMLSGQALRSFEDIRLKPVVVRGDDRQTHAKRERHR